MTRRQSRPAVVPGAPPAATTVSAEPTREQINALVGEIAKLEYDGADISTDEGWDALEPEQREKLTAYYHRFKAAPKDPTPEQIQAGADDAIDARLAVEAGGHALLPNGDIDPTKLGKPVLTKDGWVCPAPKKA